MTIEQTASIIEERGLPFPVRVLKMEDHVQICICIQDASGDEHTEFFRVPHIVDRVLLDGLNEVLSKASITANLSIHMGLKVI